LLDEVKIEAEKQNFIKEEEYQLKMKTAIEEA